MPRELNYFCQHESLHFNCNLISNLLSWMGEGNKLVYSQAGIALISRTNKNRIIFVYRWRWQRWKLHRKERRINRRKSKCDLIGWNESKTLSWIYWHIVVKAAWSTKPPEKFQLGICRYYKIEFLIKFTTTAAKNAL